MAERATASNDKGRLDLGRATGHDERRWRGSLSCVQVENGRHRKRVVKPRRKRGSPYQGAGVGDWGS
jgi:hypothetical protein